MPNFMHAPHAQLSLTNFPNWDSNFGELTHSRGTTQWEQKFPSSPKNQNTKLTHCSIYASIEQYLPHTQNEHRAHPNWAPTIEPTVSCWRYTPTPKQDRFQDLLEAICPDFLHTTLTKYNNYHCYSNIPQLLSAVFKPCKELLQMLVSCFISHFMSLSTTGLILLNLISTFLHHLMKRKVIGSVLPTTKVTVSPGGSSLRILKRSSFVLAFEVLSELQQTSVLHHLQGRKPHFLFPFPILNNLKILCHLTPLMHQHPILSKFVKSQSGEDEDNPIHMANIDIPNLLGRSFLLPPEDNGECHMAKIIDIDDHGQPLEDIKFKLKINKDQAEEIMSYNQLMDYIQKGTGAEEDPDSLFNFRDIVAHQGPLESTDPDHKGSKYNVMVEWESGEVTYEPLTLISKDDPITCAVYAKKHDLLDTKGWKHLKRYAKTSKRLIRAVKQSRIRQVRASARYQHGFQVPKDYNDAIRLDKENSNTHWQDAMDLELTQIHEYKVFKDTGKAQFQNGQVVTPDGFQKIRVHFVYAVKHDGRFEARLVADGHLTKEPVESIYSGVVSLRSLRMVVFLSQLNDLEIWVADVGNAYLEAYTDEKLCIIAGPEFKELQGHLLIMIKALYGTCSGGARWHDRLFDILQELKFKPSKADPDVWMRPEPGGTCYEYIAVYVDDLAIAAKDPQAFCHELKKKYNLKLKGVGPLEYHLSCTYKKDPDGTLAADPRRYVNKILESYERMFKEKPRKSRPPFEGGDHPELDTSELCDEHQTKQFQTLIGQLQWLISLGRSDIAVHVMSLSRFRAQPRKGHLDRAKRIVGYLLFLPDGAIRFRTGEPDFSSLKDQEYDWTRSVHSGACEQIPHDIPKSLGKHVQTSHYVDANLHHDLATGKAVTAVLHFLNQTPIDAYTKRQSTVETATYGSEFVAARTAVDQIIDIRRTLQYLGVSIRDKSYMFGDNRSVVTSSTIPNSAISKRHHLASYHRVREAIAAKYISFHWKDGKSNPADILSKHWEFATVWPMLKPILFWRGETATQLKGSDRIPSTTPGTEPPRDVRDSGSARSHSTHLETSSSDRP